MTLPATRRGTRIANVGAELAELLGERRIVRWMELAMLPAPFTVRAVKSLSGDAGWPAIVRRQPGISVAWETAEIWDLAFL